MHKYRAFVPYFFLFPALAILFFFQFFAWGWNINIALRDVTIMNFRRAWPFVGLQNFRDIFTDPVTLITLRNTAIFATTGIVSQLLIGTGIAYLLFRAERKVENIFRPIFIIPWLTSVLVASFGWRLVLGRDTGIVNMLISSLGFEPISFIGHPATAMLAIVIANIWRGTPFTILLMNSAMTSINPQLVEASKIDGASQWTFYTKIALPILKPFILMNTILITVWTINAYGLILNMTGGGPLNATRVFPLHGYLAAFSEGRFSFAAGITMLSVLMTLVLIYFYLRFYDVELVD